MDKVEDMFSEDTDVDRGFDFGVSSFYVNICGLGVGEVSFRVCLFLVFSFERGVGSLFVICWRSSRVEWC